MITYRVVAVPERAERAAALASEVDGCVVLDEHHDGTFANHLRALRSVGYATHAVILEDDAILCPDFTSHVRDLVSERPEDMLGLYVGRVAPRSLQGLLAGLTADASGWLDHPKVTDRLRWAVGYVIPVKDIPEVLASFVGPQHAWLDTDRRLGAWHAARGRLSYPFPSLVDHDDEVRSTTSRAGRGRVAWAHCGGADV